MVNTTVIKSLENKITDGEFEKNSKENLNGSYLFFSFDLVNSTMFKPFNENWPEVIRWFYGAIKDEIEKQIPSITEWKKVGDEVLFYLPVKDELEELKSSPQKTYKVLKETIKQLHNVFANLKGILSIKATLWIAYLNEVDNKAQNILIKTTDIDKTILEFLGPDIDIGFRIAKYALQGKVVLDAKLACLLSKLETELEENNISSKLKIVSYEELKGVWNGRKYPIVWYHENWGNSDDMFLYDEETNSSIVKKIKDTNFKCIEDIGKLTKVFKDLGRIDEIRKLRDGIQEYKTNNPSGIINTTVSRERLSEIHFVVMMVNEFNEILALQRLKDKNFNPNKWEFGCAQLHLNQSILDAINIGYKKDLGLKDDFINSQIEFIDFYHFSKLNRIIPGTIFTTKIEKNLIKQEMINSQKHQSMKWIKNEEELKDFDEDNCVEDFHKHIKMVFKKYE